MKPAVLATLTGMRLLAALWVVAFHIYLYNSADLTAEHPVVAAIVGPVVGQGDLGVDLFFLLSGFVLAHNYLDRLGAQPSLPDTVRFLWLRVARIWPLYTVAVAGGGLLLSLRLHVWGTEPNVPLTRGRFVEQALMVQQWGAGNVPNTSWTGPAWSISAEWLAYLCFPALAVLVWRLRARTGRRVTVALAMVALLPTLVWTTAAHTQAAPFMWLARLASEFTCGVLLSAALSHGAPRVRRSATGLTVVATVAAVAWLYAAALLARPWLGPLVLAIFPLLVISVAYGDGRVHRWLGSRAMVLGGGVSFALYLVHVPLLKLFRDALEHGVVPLPPRFQVEGELVVSGLSLLIAYVLFRYVEEPARRRLRALTPRVIASVDRLRLPVPVSGASLEPAVEHAPEQHTRQLVR